MYIQSKKTIFFYLYISDIYTGAVTLILIYFFHIDIPTMGYAYLALHFSLSASLKGPDISCITLISNDTITSYFRRHILIVWENVFISLLFCTVVEY